MVVGIIMGSVAILTVVGFMIYYSTRKTLPSSSLAKIEEQYEKIYNEHKSTPNTNVKPLTYTGSLVDAFNLISSLYNWIGAEWNLHNVVPIATVVLKMPTKPIIHVCTSDPNHEIYVWDYATIPKCVNLFCEVYNGTIVRMSCNTPPYGDVEIDEVDDNTIHK